jgi:hypothetical protein
MIVNRIVMDPWAEPIEDSIDFNGRVTQVNQLHQGFRVYWCSRLSQIHEPHTCIGQIHGYSSMDAINRYDNRGLFRCRMGFQAMTKFNSGFSHQ